MPQHLDIGVFGGRFAIGSAVDFPGLARIEGSDILRRQGLRELRRHPEALSALRRWRRFSDLFAGSIVQSDDQIFRRIEEAVARRRAVVLFVRDMPPLALFQSQDEHGRFKSAAPSPKPVAGQAKSAEPSPDDAIAAMTPRARVVLALTESRKYMLGALGDYMQELIVQGALPMLGFFLFTLIAANVANPIIGGLMDGAIMAFVVITVGSQGIHGLQMLAGAIVDAATAKDRATIDASAKTFAEAIAAVGGTVFLGWLLHRVGKLSGGTRTVSGGGGTAEEAVASRKYVDPRTQPSTKKILEPKMAPAEEVGPAFRIDLPEHLAGPGGFTKSGHLHGTHNQLNAIAALEEKGISYTIEKTGTSGISEIIYSYKNAAGKVIEGTKTVYDPAIYSDRKVLDMAQSAGNRAFELYNKDPSQRTFEVIQDGVNMKAYINMDPTTGTPFIGNVHPVK